MRKKNANDKLKTWLNRLGDNVNQLKPCSILANIKKLDIKQQLRFVRDNFPDVWEMAKEGNCPGFYIKGQRTIAKCNDCEECWNKALESEAK